MSIELSALPADHPKVWKREMDNYLSDALYELTELAHIPDDHRTYDFWEEFSTVIYDLLGYRFWTEPEIVDNAFLEAEEAMRRARAALGRLNQRQREHLAARLEKMPVGKHCCRYHLGADVLDDFVLAFARITGKQPVPRRLQEKRRGRPNGSIADWRFHLLVGALFLFPWKYGGGLTFHDRDSEKGTLARALRLLAPLFPTIVPHHLPLDTIADIRDGCVKDRESDAG